jgi:mono/diheme cytochrome c family protein
MVVSLFVGLLQTAGAYAVIPGADGKALYAEHCASCHGKDGGGDGVLAADLRFKPRAFKEGKFAFGNTPDAMAKTVRSGVPGREVPQMPAFKDVLSDEDVAAVVTYVRTLMPPMPELTPADMKMEVRETAKVVRGILAPLADGEKPIPRGLLVGLPSGFSFEYANEDRFHLVAVRRGEFLTRSDWEGRGGRPLTPLGTPLWSAPAPEQWIPFAVADPPPDGEHAEFAFAQTRLRETAVRGRAVDLELELLDAAGHARARVTERPREISISGGAGVVQEFTIRATAGRVAVLCSLAIGSDPKRALPAPPEVTKELTADMPPLVRHGTEQMGVMGATGWWVAAPPGGGFACVRIDAPDEAIVGNDNEDSHDCVDVQVVVGADPVVVRRTVIFRPDATLAQLGAMTRELQ